MTTAEWIVLDFGNVICGYDFDPFVQFLFENGTSSRDEIMDKVFGANGLLGTYEVGMITTQEFVTLTQQTLAPNADYQQVEVAFSNIFEEWPSAIAVLPRLASRFRLALISDTNPLHFDKMIAPVVTPYFETVVLSYQVGYSKPDAALFRAFLDKAQARPESCLFFDDFEPNVEGARRMGIPSHTVAGPTGLSDTCLRLGLI
jgi:HAD superfamily hydrolase (TIGR01509 family)